MTYIPKNKIITNLYTNIKELAYKDTGEFYIGNYWESYDGKIYTGKNPNDKPSRELIKIKSTEEDENPLIQTKQIAYTDAPTVLDDINDKRYSEDLVIEYSRLKKVNLNDIEKQIVPKHLYPKPTEDDYKLGVFDRYFLYKINEPIFLEVDEDVYKAVKGKDEKYYTTPYIQFLMSWALEGDKSEVYDVNKRIIELTEKRIKRRGLKEFLKFDYIKFWLPE